jgi:branched-chain amino acid transport system ATP-binding protein
MTNAVISSEKLCAGYGSLPVLRDVTLDVRPGEVVVLLGANGAGKSTTLKALAGYLRPTDGTIYWNSSVKYAPAHVRARQGMRYVPDERAIFASMSVSDNLRIGRQTSNERALELFPELAPLLKRRAGLLSGGEQQMLVLARALSARPRLLIADEVSLGLAPLVVRRLLRAVRDAADAYGTAALLVEQQLRAGLEVADRGYVMQRGRLVLEGSAAELLARMNEIETAYLSGPTTN